MIDYSIIGKRFGRLTVKELDHIGKNHGSWWKCACDCGNETVVYRGSLTSGDIVSCGCYRKENKMIVSEICKIVQDCERLRSIILQDEHDLTTAEQQKICDLLWDYRCELLKKEVK